MRPSEYNDNKIFKNVALCVKLYNYIHIKYNFFFFMKNGRKKLHIILYIKNTHRTKNYTIVKKKTKNKN